MKTIQVVIEGLRPILLHNPESMLKPRGSKKKIPSPEEEAADSCYWTEDGSSLAFPGLNIGAAMLRVAPAYKLKGQRRMSVTPYVAGSVEIEPIMVPFGTKKYEIDIRRVVVQRSGIMRARAKLLKWKLAFAILVDQDFPAETDVLREMLEEVGRRIGLGDYRPEKKGPFGKFRVIKWQEVKS